MLGIVALVLGTSAGLIQASTTANKFAPTEEINS